MVQVSRNLVINLFVTAILSFLVLNGCEKKVINVPATEGIARLPVIGNVEIILDFEAIGGKTVTVKNGNDRGVGVYIVKNNDPSIIIFSDGWIGKRKSSVHTGINFEYGWELKVTVVIYKDLAGAIIAFINALGPNFLDEIKEFWIENRYEKTVVIEKS